MKELVTIILPVYKGELYIREALASIGSQSYNHWDLIVVEDGPNNDGSAKIIAEFSHNLSKQNVRYYCTPQRRGLAHVRNFAIRRSKGKYIALLDHDDIWKEDHLDNSLRGLKQSVADMVYAPVVVFGPCASPAGAVYGPTKDEVRDFPASLYARNFICPSSCVIKADVFSRIGLFNEKRYFAEDWDFWLRMARVNMRIKCLQSPSCYYRKHSLSLTADIQKVIQSRWFIAVSQMDWPAVSWATKLKIIVKTSHDLLRHFIEKYCKLQKN